MRTTLNIRDELMREVKRRAVDTGRSITAVIEDALQQSLEPSQQRPKRFKLKWVTVKGKLQHGVDLDDRDALYERMEGRA